MDKYEIELKTFANKIIKKKSQKSYYNIIIKSISTTITFTISFVGLMSQPIQIDF